MKKEDFDREMDRFSRSIRRAMEIRVELRALFGHLRNSDKRLIDLMEDEEDPDQKELLELAHEVCYLARKDLASDDMMRLILDFRDLKDKYYDR